MVAPATLRAARRSDAPALAELASGDPFELLELMGGVAWGIATGPGLVGYVDGGAIAAQ